MRGSIATAGGIELRRSATPSRMARRPAMLWPWASTPPDRTVAHAPTTSTSQLDCSPARGCSLGHSWAEPCPSTRALHSPARSASSSRTRRPRSTSVLAATGRSHAAWATWWPSRRKHRTCAVIGTRAAGTAERRAHLAEPARAPIAGARHSSTPAAPARETCACTQERATRAVRRRSGSLRPGRRRRRPHRSGSGPGALRARPGTHEQ